ncbi:thioredoxin domain-containing protein [Corynebacterium sp. sy039]|uniref:DsbA family protein n=1 Tax=Corynebacterium sp. sy039 TaxID=2599641 RepID=UPI0011B56B7F|nr:thioredoxin domain-containing protein [Corynebacterium sp. sy039]QDZ43290.1 disulfide bond formation protein DsbA [Corynebacterium sp. sy039]
MAQEKAQQKPHLTPALWALIISLIVLAGTAGFLGGRASVTTADTQAAQNLAQTDKKSTGKTAGKKPKAGTQKQSTNPKDLDPFIYGPGGEPSPENVTAVHRRNPEDPFAIGPVDAPVVISEFSDFECPFCSTFANQVLPEIIDTYVDAGLVRIEWNDTPVNGPNAIAAAKAGRAAAAQGKFNEFAKAYYTASKNINGHPNFTQADFERFAQTAKVADMDKFRTQATDSTFDEVVEEAKNYATAIGVSGTPSFLIGEQYLSGAQKAETFMEIIEQQLEQAADKQTTGKSAEKSTDKSTEKKKNK